MIKMKLNYYFLQRHCRLKHNGNISIEHLGKTNNNSDNRRRHRYQPQKTSQTPAALTSLQTVPLTDVTIPPAVDVIKRYKCQFCPYESNSKSQLQYHLSFHTQNTNTQGEEIYNCTFCTYSVTRRHLLLQHLKMHSPLSINGADAATESIEVADNDTVSISPKKEIFYCSVCPARYMSKTEIDTHVGMHEGGMTFKCKLCSYTAATDSNITAHITVHSNYYQEKTKEFQRKYQGNVDYPPPKIALANVSVMPSTSNGDMNGEQFWICEPRPFLEIHERHLLPLLTQCKFCPFIANVPDELKSHVTHHRMFNGCTFEFKCDHCDYSTKTKEDIVHHKKLHFALISDDVATLSFYTNYEKLELKCMDLSKTNERGIEECQEYKRNTSIYMDDDTRFREKLARLSAINDDNKMIIKLE